MADNSFPIPESTPFHPADTPRGTMYYNLEELTDSQQIKLNSLKIDTIRENNKYLAANPEIKAIIALVLRNILRHRPMIKIHEFIAKFFNRSSSAIQDEISEYLDQKEILSTKEISVDNLILSKKPTEKKQLSIPQSLDFICSEECTCEHSVGFKIPNYTPFDNMSFKETEHWLTPKSSRSSMISEETSEEMISGELSFSEMARMIDLVGADEEEGTESRINVDVNANAGESSEEHIVPETSDQEDQNILKVDEQVDIGPQEKKESPSAEEENTVTEQDSPLVTEKKISGDEN